MERPQNKNLIPGAHPLSIEEASKGGKASGETRRAKKTLRELADDLLSFVVKDERLTGKYKKLGINGDGKGKYTFKEAILIGQIVQAAKGDTKAYNAIRDTLEPKDDATVGAVEDLTPLADLLRLDNNEEGGDDDDE